MKFGFRAGRAGMPKGRRPGDRAAVAALVTVLAAAAGAPCAAQPRSMADRLELPRGMTVVVPVTFASDREAFLPWPARLEDGRIIGAEVYRLTFEEIAPEASPLARWLPPRLRWQALHNESVKLGTPPGFWAIVLLVPIDASGPVRIGGEAWDVTWFDDQPRPPAPEELDPRTKAALDEAATLEAGDPRWSWRGVLSGEPAAETPETADPIIGAWHAQEQARWRAGLARLRGIDAAIEARLRERLTRVIRFGPGVAAPAWESGSIVSDLASDLLDASEGRARRAALGFLESTSDVRAWVTDDAGFIDPSGTAPLSTLAIANLSDETVLVRPRVRGGGAIAVEPGNVSTWTGLGEAPGAGLLPRLVLETPGATLEFDVGSLWFAVRPPGLTTPAFADDWTMATWLTGAESPSPVARARVLRASPEVEVVGDSSGPGVVRRERVTPERWVLYFEADAGAEARVWIGPRGRPTSIVHVTRDGLIDDELVPGRVGEFEGRVTSTEGGWAFTIDLPKSERLQLGIEHRDASGARVAWPRAMFPWQSEPGRVGLDLTRWDE